MPNFSLKIEKQGCFIVTIKILNLMNGWNDHEISTKNVSLSSREEYIRKIKMIHGNYPLVYLLYFFPHLYNRQFFKLNEAGISGCIIGMNRQKDFIQYLLSLGEKPLEASSYINFTSKRGVST